MYKIIRPFLFQLDEERAHDLTLKALHWLPFHAKNQLTTQPIRALGLTFPHPIGLAAGLDKNGRHIDALAKLGFSFIELGTVTPKPQLGNPKPRLFRIPQANAIINRMGFNNLGVDALIKNVERSSYQGILGINIGKNKDTPLHQAVSDYLYCLKKVYSKASYITINISSPNTPDLRQLQQGEFFINLLTQLTEEQQRLADIHGYLVPLLVKLSPDETDEALKQMAEAAAKKGIAGIIATNTTCAHDAVAKFPNGQETGGLSGPPLAKRSTHCLQIIKQTIGDAVTLIGVGGIDNVQEAKDKLAAGAALLQVYTGLIYQGPALIKKLVTGLT